MTVCWQFNFCHTALSQLKVSAPHLKSTTHQCFPPQLHQTSGRVAKENTWDYNTNCNTSKNGCKNHLWMTKRNIVMMHWRSSVGKAESSIKRQRSVSKYRYRYADVLQNNNIFVNQLQQYKRFTILNLRRYIMMIMTDTYNNRNPFCDQVDMIMMQQLHVSASLEALHFCVVQAQSTELPIQWWGNHWIWKRVNTKNIIMSPTHELLVKKKSPNWVKNLIWFYWVNSDVIDSFRHLALPEEDPRLQMLTINCMEFGCCSCAKGRLQILWLPAMVQKHSC